MPRSSARPCKKPGCGALSQERHGLCPDHASGATASPVVHGERLASHLRGYDYAWRRLSKRHRAAFPLCAACLEAGRTRAATLVDHVVPVDVDPDRRLDPDNLRSLCAADHALKTAEDMRRYGSPAARAARARERKG